ncbi:MAG: dipeptidase [Candidatus Parabeggiatoa sp. nov. 1]|nr:MAG: dipeptidase [Gammaproteobacteria bacterium]
MKSIIDNRFIVCLLWMAMICSILPSKDVDACTSIMAGKKATDSEIILVARNEDFSKNNWNKYLVFRHYPEYHTKNGSDNPVVKEGIWTLGNGLKVPVPENEFSYSAMPDADAYEEATNAIGNRFYFEERGINQRNVAISATNSVEVNDKAKRADPLVTIGIAESIIPTLILPQAETALGAVQLLGHYVEQYGASKGNGILIGDPEQSWYFEIGSGHHWIAVKVPEDSYIAVANGMRVHSVDLDSKNVLHSKGLFEFVSKHKLLDKPKRHLFNFAKAFGIPGVPYNVDRIWLAQKLLTPSKVQKTRQYQYPLFLKPDNKIRVKDVMNVLRATYKGTKLEGIAKRPIGVDRTAESHIMTLDQNMPDALKGIIWQAVGTPLGAPYMPLYRVMDDIPPGYSLGSNQYSPLSAYWAFRGLYALGNFDNNEFVPCIHQLWDKYEQQFINEHEYLNRMLKEIYRLNQKTAIDFARKYSTGIAYQLVGIANKERNNLMTKITDNQGGKSERRVGCRANASKCPL